MQPILLKRAFAPLATSVRMTALRSTPAMMQKPLTYFWSPWAVIRVVTLRNSTPRVDSSVPIFPSTNFTGLPFPLVAIVSLVWVFGWVCHCSLAPLWLTSLPSSGFTAVGIAACCTVNIDNMLNWVRLHSLVNYPLKFFLTYAFGYHFCAGLRHLVFCSYWIVILLSSSSLISTLRSSPGAIFRRALLPSFGVWPSLPSVWLSWSWSLLRTRRRRRTKHIVQLPFLAIHHLYLNIFICWKIVFPFSTGCSGRGESNKTKFIIKDNLEAVAKSSGIDILISWNLDVIASPGVGWGKMNVG